MNLSERDKKAIWHPYTQHQHLSGTIPIVRGEGALLFDEDGRSYIDAVSSWWVNLHGHANPYIAEKIYRQALALEQVIFTHFTHEPAVSLAERLLKIIPGKLSKIFYSDNGSTAVEVALKMAIQYWQNKGQPQRKKIMAFHNAYHGDTFGAMSISNRGIFTHAFKDLLFDVVFVETPDAFNEEKMNSVLKSHEGQIAAFIYEPLLQAAGGMKMYQAGHMNRWLKNIQAENILCIADEVLTGFGRTGPLFASESLSFPPQIVCLSKGLTGGTLALGVTACAQSLYDAFLSEDHSRTFFHGHSFTANPIACTAALASLDLLEQDSCLEQMFSIGENHKKFAENELSAITLFENIRVMGTVLAFELKSGISGYTNEISNIIMQKALTAGIYLRPLGNTVYIMPPYCISRQQLRQVYDFILRIPSTVIGHR